MMIPQILLLVLYGIIVFQWVFKPPQYITFNVIGSWLYTGICVMLLSFGEFWSIFKAPQFIMMSLYIFNAIFALIYHDQNSSYRVGFWNSLFSVSLSISIIYWGGFFDVFFN